MKPNKKRRRSQLDPAVLADLVDRIVRVAQPERIVLFGSAARGTIRRAEVVLGWAARHISSP